MLKKRFSFVFILAVGLLLNGYLISSSVAEEAAGKPSPPCPGPHR